MSGHSNLELEMAFTSWAQSCRDPEPSDLRECRRRRGHTGQHASGHRAGVRRWNDQPTGEQP